ncbi:photosystem I assembly related protein Ycf4 [Richelia intracellularis HM01]|uniref:photosystem I assembly protein Ycf4 n=1 Tax=Richelia intracellularis TaxID=1164990 RepID=UPI0002B5C0ED|nr:photosystem I assembly protein Ycf4 [Richelia intracellularis]CCH65251.1 photosystem I assembly related protein Ycf4 [Richelia intracellularis HM01]
MTVLTSHSTGEKFLFQKVLGARRLSNYWWATTLSLGSLSFFLAGLSSYIHTNLLLITDPTQLQFLPQGLVMGLYGLAGLLLSIYLWLTIIWDLGGGYNKFNRETGVVIIFRWGFPGKNRRIEINLCEHDIQSIRIKIKEGINPQRALYLRSKNRRDIPLTRVGQPITLRDLETSAAELAKFLEVPLEGL